RWEIRASTDASGSHRTRGYATMECRPNILWHKPSSFRCPKAQLLTTGPLRQADCKIRFLSTDGATSTAQRARALISALNVRFLQRQRSQVRVLSGVSGDDLAVARSPG